MIKSSAALFLLLLLSACSDEAAPTKDAGLDSVPLDLTSTDVLADAAALDATSYCELMVEAYCPFYMRCGRMAEDDVESCRSTFLEVCNGVYEPRYAHLASEGLLELSATGVAACIAHLRDVPCEQHLLDLEGPCRKMWRGQATVGQACGFDLDSLICDASSICVLDLTLCGECKPAVGSQEACGPAASCRPPDACISGLCAPPALPGDACGADLPRCIPGAACEEGFCVAARYVAVGEACDSRNRCPHRSRCIGAKCVRTALLDEACEATIPCASGSCDAETSRCAPLRPPQTSCTDRRQCLSGRCEANQCSGLDSPCLAP